MISNLKMIHQVLAECQNKLKEVENFATNLFPQKI